MKTAWFCRGCCWRRSPGRAAAGLPGLRRPLPELPSGRRAGLGVHGSSPPERGSPQAGLSPLGVASLQADWAQAPRRGRPSCPRCLRPASRPRRLTWPHGRALRPRELSSVGAVTGRPSGAPAGPQSSASPRAISSERPAFLPQ